MFYNSRHVDLGKLTNEDSLILNCISAELLTLNNNPMPLLLFQRNKVIAILQQ